MPELIDDALGRLQGLLFGNGPTPEIPAELNWPSELGVKTKKQHAAEKQMLETVLTALMASAAVDSELEGANAKEFAHATCRHFALLMAAGWASSSVRVHRYSTSKTYFFYNFFSLFTIIVYLNQLGFFFLAVSTSCSSILSR